MEDYLGLLKYCITEQEVAKIEALAKFKTQKETAKHLGINRRNLERSLKKVRERAGNAGYSPDHGLTHGAPPGADWLGASVYRKAVLDGDGNEMQPAHWDKYKADTGVAVASAIEDVIEHLNSAKVTPLPKIKHDKRKTNNQLLNLYTLTDAHIGMLAHAEEGGADWNLEIAKETIYAAVRHLIDNSPDAEVGFFNQLGDGIHFDSMLPITPKSGHIVDAAGRYPQVIDVSVEIFRQCIAWLLEKHEKVVVLMAKGNHDPAGSSWLQVLMEIAFENNPRVEVIRSVVPYYAYVHGKTLLGFHHGDKKSVKSLPELMNAEYRHLLSETVQTYLHTGHKHHREVKETALAIVEQHPTLAARDSHAAQGGWHSRRGMSCITYDNCGNEPCRTNFTPKSQR